ncbi:MAG: 2-polyprenyl-3-methyl-6-methoxy-1,4-benzoquinone monooxygenase [Pseudomonadota bacterium]
MPDRLLIEVDRALRTLAGTVTASRPAPEPARDFDGDGDLSPADRQHAGALMRVNHAGEVCAQALYSGQAMMARDPTKRELLLEAAREEGDHLAWTRQRLQELDARPSLLNPLWYAGSFAMGALAGLAGDRWSLGFVVETERQVEAHLDRHLESLPAHDQRSRAVVEQMREDEIRHARSAQSRGAAFLPRPVRSAMRATSRVMTGSAYWI